MVDWIPRLALAAAAELAPVPPKATGIAVPFQVPAVIVPTVERGLREAYGPQGSGPSSSRDVTDELLGLAKEDSQPSLSRYLARHADIDEFTEFVMHRSLYTLKEADPHSFVIARLDGAPKTVKEGVGKDEAASIKKLFEEAGAQVEIK